MEYFFNSVVLNFMVLLLFGCIVYFEQIEFYIVGWLAVWLVQLQHKRFQVYKFFFPSKE